MILNQTLNDGPSSCDSGIDWKSAATHNVSVFYSETAGGQISGPFTLSVARKVALAALCKDNVVKVTIEVIS